MRNPLLKNITKISDNIYKIEIGQKNNLDFTGSLVRIASFITAMARINLNKGMLEVGYDNVYYCDTDSIITS